MALLSKFYVQETLTIYKIKSKLKKRQKKRFSFFHYRYIFPCSLISSFILFLEELEVI